MKQLFAASAAALLLSACQTAYPGGPYGQPYPPPDPYAAPSPPQQPYGPGPGGSCPIASSRDWQAWVDAMPGPGPGPTLVVKGTVVAPTGGYRMEFEPHLQAMRSYPVQLVARLRPMPPDGAATQALTTHDVRWQWPLQSGPVGAVTIACGDQTLARISPVETAQ